MLFSMSVSVDSNCIFSYSFTPVTLYFYFISFLVLLNSKLRYIYVLFFVTFVYYLCFKLLSIILLVSRENISWRCIFFQLVPVGTTVFRGLKAEDKDAGVNSLVEYTVVPGDGRGLGTDQGVGRHRINTEDGFGYFNINLPHQGQVTVSRGLDYEKTQRYLVTVLATVSHKL